MKSTTWLVLPLLLLAACSKEAVNEQTISSPDISNAGIIIDPNGNPTNKPGDEGAGLCPNGGPKSVSVRIDPNGVITDLDGGSAIDPIGKAVSGSAQTDEGSGLDPHGKPLHRDEGGFIDPNGRDVGPRMDDNGRMQNYSGKDEGGWVDPNGKQGINKGMGLDPNG